MVLGALFFSFFSFLLVFFFFVREVGWMVRTDTPPFLFVYLFIHLVSFVSSVRSFFSFVDKD